VRAEEPGEAAPRDFLDQRGTTKPATRRDTRDGGRLVGRGGADQPQRLVAVQQQLGDVEAFGGNGRDARLVAQQLVDGDVALAVLTELGR